MKRAAVLFPIAAAVFYISALAGESVKVVDVPDGNTIVVERNGNKEKVKYIGVAVAEGGGMEACREAAKEMNEKLVKGRFVELETGKEERDGDGNLLAYAFIRTAPGSPGGDVFVNGQMVWEGLGVISLAPPNLKYADELEEAQKRARKRQVGLWGDAECKRLVKEPKVDPECAFIGERNSRIYHKATCQHAIRITVVDKVCFKSRKEAEKAGYRKCKNCEED